MSSEVARRANRVFIARLEAQTASLQEQTFPGRHPGPSKWLEIVRGVIETAREYLDASEAITLTQDAQLRLINDAAQLGQFAYKCLAHLRGSEASELPHQVVWAMQRWLDELGITQTSFFRAEHVANYELARFDLTFFSSIRNPSGRLREALQKIAPPIHRVTVPSRALGMLPHFAVVAHEAGHGIYPSIKLDLTRDHGAETRDLLTRVVQRLNGNISQQQVIELTKIASNWIEELSADAIAHHIVGPAFFFALFGFLQMSNPGYGLATSHPPNDLRRRLLFSQLTASTNSASYADVFRQHTALELVEDFNSAGLPRCPATDQLISELNNQYPSDVSIMLAELIPFMGAIARTIYSETENYLSKHSKHLVYTPSKFNSDLSDHLDALCASIPPIERRQSGSGSQTQPTELATILNVGWVALTTRLDRIHVQPGPYGNSDSWKMERLHSQLLKAVELCEAKRAWEAA